MTIEWRCEKQNDCEYHVFARTDDGELRSEMTIEPRLMAYARETNQEEQFLITELLPHVHFMQVELGLVADE